MKHTQYTKYETARIIAARALQLSMNAPILLKLTKEELEKINYDVIKIAEMEFKSGILPITIKRPSPIKEKLLVLEEETEETYEEEASPEEREKEEKEIVEETVKEILEGVEEEESEEKTEASFEE